jgi:hypothetical protein
MVFKKLLSKFVNEGKFDLIFRKIFFFILDEKYFLKVTKNLEISYYLLIILNLVLNLLIAIYFVFNLFFLLIKSLRI